MGRAAIHSGREITWEEMTTSKFQLYPGRIDDLNYDSEPPVKPDANGFYPVPVPGVGTRREPGGSTSPDAMPKPRGPVGKGLAHSFANHAIDSGEDAILRPRKQGRRRSLATSGKPIP